MAIYSTTQLCTGTLEAPSVRVMSSYCVVVTYTDAESRTRVDITGTPEELEAFGTTLLGAAHNAVVADALAKSATAEAGA